MSRHEAEMLERIAQWDKSHPIATTANAFLIESAKEKYSYNFFWMDRPIIQYPQDIIAVQELIWRVRPDLIIETGIAHGGSLIMSASILALIEYSDALTSNTMLDPASPTRRVLGVDIDIREHNRLEIEKHPMSGRIDMLQGSSIAPEVVAEIHDRARAFSNVMVFLDSNHTYAHVKAELEAYGPLVSPGSYCVVFDTLIEDMPAGLYHDRDWDKGNNPKTAVWEFLSENSNFEIDKTIQEKLLITVASDGYLKRRL